jgi:oxygen-independent coproporphyrinogen-3 oxidase
VAASGDGPCDLDQLPRAATTLSSGGRRIPGAGARVTVNGVIMAEVLFDRDLHEKYDAPLPRYTSYPTAPHFSPDFDGQSYRAAAHKTNSGASARPLSLYVHIPFCESLCYYCACNKIITQHPEKAATYIDYLERELAMLSPLFDSARELTQLHFGGGTPTFLDDDQLARVMTAIGDNFRLAPAERREFSIEMDPRAVGKDTIATLGKLGFNRISIGVQDFDERVQRAVNRIQSVALTRGVIDQARDAGFGSVSLDLIYGLPFQTRETFDTTLDEVLAIRPERLSIYSYAHLPQRVKAQRLIRGDALPSPQEKLAILERTIERLTAGGYRYIGMDHFALPDSELARAQDDGTLQRNFQGYSTHAVCDLIGAGNSAIGRLGDSFTQNEHAINDYYAAIDAGQLPIKRGYTRDADDHLRADLIERLMCRDGVDLTAFGAEYDLDAERYFADELDQLEPLIADGLLDRDGPRLHIHAPGRLLRRNIAAIFDAYLGRSAQPVRYSRSI